MRLLTIQGAYHQTEEHIPNILLIQLDILVHGTNKYCVDRNTRMTQQAHPNDVYLTKLLYWSNGNVPQ